jgi:predicted RNase H-like HicB family nuclease
MKKRTKASLSFDGLHFYIPHSALIICQKRSLPNAFFRMRRRDALAQPAAKLACVVVVDPVSWIAKRIGGLILSRMNRMFTAVIKKDGRWWIGWVEEVPGVNSQGKTRKELVENLRSALQEALEINRASALEAAGDAYEELSIPV